MPVYQSNYVKPTHSDNKMYHAKYWEEFKPYDKPITGVKVNAVLINCSDKYITFTDKDDKTKQICCEVTRCVFLILNSKTKAPTDKYIEYQIWGRRKEKKGNEPWGEWGANSWEVQQFTAICHSQKTDEEMSVVNSLDSGTKIYPEMCGVMFVLAVAQKGEYVTKLSAIPQYKVKMFYPDGRSYDEVESETPVSECEDLKLAIMKCKEVYADYLDSVGGQAAAVTSPYTAQPVKAKTEPVVEAQAEPVVDDEDEDDLPF